MITMEMVREVYTERHYFEPFAREYGSRVPTIEEQEAIFESAIRRLGAKAFRSTNALNKAIRDVTTAWCKAKRETAAAEAMP